MLVTVSAYMPSHISKLSATDVTFVRFLTSVNASMNAQMTIPRKLGITCFTFIRFLTSVNASMSIQVATRCTLGTTRITITFLDSVSTDMFLQVTPISKLRYTCRIFFFIFFFSK